MADYPSPYVVVVIGAGSGIGRGAALALASRGATVLCADRSQEACRAAAAEIRAAGGRADAYALDVADRAAQAPVWEAVHRQNKQIHALLNCAGITGRTNLKAHEVEPDDFLSVFNVNLFGALLATQAVLPGMLEHGYGRILHIASIAGKEGNAGMTAYSATKAGLIGMVKSMAKDYAETGITINALAPAVIRTPMVAAMPAAQVTYMTDKIPMKRCGELPEAAEMIAFILSPACSFTTGFTFDLSGGRATY